MPVEVLLYMCAMQWTDDVSLTVSELLLGRRHFLSLLSVAAAAALHRNSFRVSAHTVVL